MPSGQADWPVFLTGCHRSGTTLVRFLLDAHPRIACPPESKFICGLYEFLEYPQLLPALHSLHWGPPEIFAELGNFARRLLDGYAARQHKSRWVDKTPNYYRILPFLDDIFQNQARYLFLLRHPLDTVASLDEQFRFAGTGFPDPEIAHAIQRYGPGPQCWAHYWREVYETIDVFASASPERAHLFRYEDLVTRPREVLGGVFDFLREEFDDGILVRAFEMPHDEGYGDGKIRLTSDIRTGSIGRWKAWDRARAESLWSIVELRAARFGYSLDGEAQ